MVLAMRIWDVIDPFVDSLHQPGDVPTGQLNQVDSHNKKPGRQTSRISALSNTSGTPHHSSLNSWYLRLLSATHFSLSTFVASHGYTSSRYNHASFLKLGFTPRRNTSFFISSNLIFGRPSVGSNHSAHIFSSTGCLGSRVVFGSGRLCLNVECNNSNTPKPPSSSLSFSPLGIDMASLLRDLSPSSATTLAHLAR